MGIFGLPLRKSTDTEPKAGTILKEGKQIMIFSPALALLYIRLHMIHCVSVFSGAVNAESKADVEGALHSTPIRLHSFYSLPAGMMKTRLMLKVLALLSFHCISTLL